MAQVPPSTGAPPKGPVAPVNVGMQIPEGIMFLYKFAANGTVGITSEQIQPFPYAVASQNQFYAVSYGAFVSADTNFPKVSPDITAAQASQSGFWGWWGAPDATVTLTNTWDTFIRDECRQPGTTLGGKHAGEPLANTQVALLPQSKKYSDLAYIDKGGSGSGAHPGGGQQQGPGAGAVPILTEQDGWGRNIFPFEPSNGLGSVYTPYLTGPAAGAVRPTYSTNGTAFDIRFRRQITLQNATITGVGGVGYIADTGP